MKQRAEFEREEDEANQKSSAAREARINAEKKVRSAVIDAYRQCLLNHAEALAIVSNEPAEVIARAAFPSCAKQRQAVIDATANQVEPVGYGEISEIDGLVEKEVLLRVIEARAATSSPVPGPDTKPADTPL